MVYNRESAPEPAPENARMYMLHHDIRSALSDVLSGLDLVDDSVLNEDSRVQLDRVRAAAAALSPLIDEVLTELPSEAPFANNLTDGARVPLLDMLRSVQRRWSGLARVQGLRLETDLATDLPILVDLDGRSLERILSNLLSNALKYSEAGGTITLAVDLRAGGDLRFMVTDAGPGFSDAALARLFEYRGRPAESLRPGSGLGLHICKSLADTLGGHIEVTNAERSGARVSLVLPRSSWSDSNQPECHVLPDLSGLRVLVAEDNPSNQAIFRQMLEHMGAEVCVRENGRTALEALTNQDYDIALVDIEMPEMTGTELIECVRVLPSARSRIPILAVTAYVLRAYRDRIYRAGADGIVAKPVESFVAFGEAIRALMIKRDYREMAHRVASPQTRNPEPAPLASPDEGPADPGAVDKNRFFGLLTMAGKDGREELLRRLENDLSRVRRGVDLAIRSEDHDAIRAESHILISVAGAMGANGLHAFARRLNAAAHERNCLEVQALVAPVCAGLDTVIALLQREARSSGEESASKRTARP